LRSGIRTIKQMTSGILEEKFVPTHNFAACWFFHYQANMMPRCMRNDSKNSKIYDSLEKCLKCLK